MDYGEWGSKCSECGEQIAMTDVEGYYVGSCEKCRTHVTIRKENGEEITTHG